MRNKYGLKVFKSSFVINCFLQVNVTAHPGHVYRLTIEKNCTNAGVATVTRCKFKTYNLEGIHRRSRNFRLKKGTISIVT